LTQLITHSSFGCQVLFYKGLYTKLDAQILYKK